MKIAISRGRDLFWYISNGRLPEEVVLKHFASLPELYKFVEEDIPEIVVLEGHTTEEMVDIVKKIKSHVFARNALFVVATSDHTVNTRRALMVAGAGYTLYRRSNKFPLPMEFGKILKWFFNTKNPDLRLFDVKPKPFIAKAHFTTHGRLGWISSQFCFMECNLDLHPGDKIKISNNVLEELGVESIMVQCVEKNKVGRFYHYSNSYLCQILMEGNKSLHKNLHSWIEANEKSSWDKPVKVVFYEDSMDYRQEIRAMMKENVLFCPRGYKGIEALLEDLNYHLPQLVLINRSIISKGVDKFNQVKKYLKTKQVIIITYSHEPVSDTDLETLKKNYPFALHSQGKITSDILSVMVKKIQQKMSETKTADHGKKVVFKKNSINSHVKMMADCQVTDLSEIGINIKMPYSMNNFCAVELSCPEFTTLKLNRIQFFRSLASSARKDESGNMVHRLIFTAQTEKEQEFVLRAIGKYTEETEPEET